MELYHRLGCIRLDDRTCDYTTINNLKYKSIEIEQ